MTKPPHHDHHVGGRAMTPLPESVNVTIDGVSHFTQPTLRYQATSFDNMKTSVVLALSLATSANAFAPRATAGAFFTQNPNQALSTSSSTCLHASPSSEPSRKENQVKSTAAAFLLGCSLMLMSPTAVFADATSLDFSLPKYDANMQGFGDGTEAILNTRGRADRTDPGANEKEKQAESMRKAEEARQAAKEKKKAEMKALEEETKRRALEKKARDAERLKNIWN